MFLVYLILIQFIARESVCCFVSGLTKDCYEGLWLLKVKFNLQPLQGQYSIITKDYYKRLVFSRLH